MAAPLSPDVAEKIEVPFGDLTAQYQSIKKEMDAAIQGIVDSNKFILGSTETPFDRAFAEYCRTSDAVGCSCGTSAIYVALAALGLPRDAEVIVPALTYPATAEAVTLAGARPVFVDVEEETGLLDPGALEAAITPNTWGIIPVHLYGQMAEMDAIMTIAEKHGLKVVEDSAQAHGAEYHGRRPGSQGHAATFSFFPGKNLGAYGDAGAIVTNDAALADWMRQYRNHGRTDKYRHDFIGFNFRMDGMQAAVLSVKLPHMEEWTEGRRRVAAAYREGLEGVVDCLIERPYNRHVYHLFVIRHQERDRLKKALAADGISCGLHYPIPMHLQPAFAEFSPEEGAFPVSEALCGDILSLPVFPELSDAQIEHVIRRVKAHA